MDQLVGNAMKAIENVFDSQKVDKVNMSNSTTCRPLNRNDFLYRASTFSIANWFAKPEMIDPYACALYGWINTGKDEITCCLCDAILHFRINPAVSSEVAQRIACIYSKQLHTDHNQGCAWIDNPCSSSFLSLPYISPRQYYQHFIATFKRWYNTAQDCTLPPLSPSYPIEYSVLSNIFEISVTKCSNPFSKQASEIATSTLVALAISGWEPIDDTMYCKYCNRTCGLWHFHTDNPLDPSTQHRFFCPWISSNTKSGIQLTLEAIQSQSSFQDHVRSDAIHVKPKEAFERIRQCLDLI